MRHWLSSLTKESRYSLLEFMVFFTLSRQIRGLRIKRGWTQAQLAENMGTTQPAVARLETFRGCRNTTVTTLCKVAATFNVALQVRFCAWGEWVEYYLTPDGKFINKGLRPEALTITTFTQEYENGMWT